MITSKEMADLVFQIRDDYIENKKRKNKKILNIVKFSTPALACFSLAIAFGIGYWANFSNIPEVELQPVTTHPPSEPIHSDAVDSKTKTTKSTEAKTMVTSVVNGNTKSENDDTTNETYMTAHEDKAVITEKTYENVPSAVTTAKVSQKVTSFIAVTSAKQTTITSVVTNITGSNSTNPEVSTTAVSTTDTLTEQPVTTDDRSGDIDADRPKPELPWDEKSINQQYIMAEFGEPIKSYTTAEKEVSAYEIDEFISNAYMSGYDFYTGTYYHCYAYAYTLKGDDKTAIGIRFPDDDKFYLYNFAVQNG